MNDDDPPARTEHRDVVQDLGDERLEAREKPSCRFTPKIVGGLDHSNNKPKKGRQRSLAGQSQKNGGKDITRNTTLTALAAASLKVPAAAGSAAPDDPIFAVIEKYHKAHAEMHAVEIIEDRSPLEDAVFRQKWSEQADAADELATTVPTTVPGLLAMVICVAEVSSLYPEDNDPPMPFAYGAPLFETMATAARALLKKVEV